MASEDFWRLFLFVIRLNFTIFRKTIIPCDYKYVEVYNYVAIYLIFF